MMKIPRNGGHEEKRPSFFKIILPGYSTEHLRIPPRFLRKHIANKGAKRATLKLSRSSEYTWYVQVRRSGGDMYLKHRWQKFVRDTCLGDKELLVFIYNEKMHFSVKVFDKNGCERLDFPDIRTEQGITSSKITKRPRGRPRKSSTGNSADKLKEVKEEEVDYNITGTRTKTTEENTKRGRGRPRKHTSMCTERPPVTPSSSFWSAKRSSGRPRNYQESGELFKTNFTTKILRLTQVYMPKSFYYENIHSGNYKAVFMKSSEGRKWYKVNLSAYRDTAFMTRGWGPFAVAHRIKVGSVCRFQFFEENKFIVHVLNN